MVNTFSNYWEIALFMKNTQAHQYTMTIKQCTMQTSNNSPMISLLHSPDLFEACLLFIMTPPTIMRMAAMTIGIPTPPVIPAKPCITESLLCITYTLTQTKVHCINITFDRVHIYAETERLYIYLWKPLSHTA